MKRFLFLICLLSVGKLTYANDTIIIKKDPRLDVLATKQAQINKRVGFMTSTGLYKGFRVQVISTSNRDEANKIKSDILSKFTDEKAYLVYNSPYFKVKIGNFIRRDDAEKFKKLLSKHYPQGVYVVEDAIEYSMKDDEDLSAQ